MMNVEKLFNISNKVVILTGASGFLGQQYSEALSQKNVKIVLADINYQKCKKLEEQLNKKYSNETLSLKLDVGNKKSVQSMVSKTLKKFDQIDGLINNAVFPETVKERSIPLETFPLDILQKIISVNTIGSFLCSQEVGKIMAKKKNGVIVNISSIYGMVAADQRIYGKSGLNSSIGYALTKSSVINLTRYLSSYWGNKGIRVNTLTLGGVEYNQDPEFIKKYSEKTMIGRMAQKDEYVGALVFLLSDASSYMIGSNLIVDGGWTAW
ncbi:MAG: SDR family oxidoreductase [Nitrosarchaeum sp.]|nr:MAG: SDR family oxidoreductase [Nitrosarchaeum sp.]